MRFLEINAQELESKLNSSTRLFLVDVRENYEFEDFNIGGVNIPMSEVMGRIDELKQHTEIILCCASGKRSGTVAYHLTKRLPSNKVYSLAGGLENFQLQHEQK
jgi:adenylyltransferase/sulfurtransferase